MKYILILCIALITIPTHGQKRFIQIDGKKIWLNTIGLEGRIKGQPVLVFESGLGTPMDNWDRILPGAAKQAPIITYDRPGVGGSEPDTEIPTIKNVSVKLLKILAALEVEPPYILIGHSLGGVYVRGFAVYYPELLAGLIIIDPGDFTETRDNKRLYYEDLGWNKEQVDAMIETITSNLVKRRINQPISIQEEGQVLADLRENDFKEIANSPLPNIPVHILTGGRFDMPESLRSKEFDEELVFRSKMKHRVSRWTDVIQSVDKGMLFYSADAGHFVHYDDPELALSSIRIVLADYKQLISQSGTPRR